MSKSGYRDLVVWQKARELASRVYRVSRAFPRSELFGLTAQMRRAALSVPCNIAEGHGRRSTADRIQFLVVARGSLLELETQAIIAADLEFMSQALSDDIVDKTTDIARALNGLIRHYARNGR
jgi:four helix bundle protein